VHACVLTTMLSGKGSIHRAQFAIVGGPLIPDGAAALLQPLGVAVAAQEPQQLQDDALQVHLLRGHQRKALAQVKAHLVAEHTGGASAGAVGLGHARGEHVAHEVFVLGSHGAAGR